VTVIRLTNTHGQPVRVNLAYLVLYAAHGAGSRVVFHDGSELVVPETPEAIDRLIVASNGAA